MLFSRGWTKRLGGTLQNDLSYATVLVFGGESRRLYREAQLAYIISDEKNPTNHPIYAVDTDFGTCILHVFVQIDTTTLRPGAVTLIPRSLRLSLSPATKGGRPYEVMKTNCRPVGLGDTKKRARN